jgi:hypothetical protein
MDPNSVGSLVKMYTKKVIPSFSPEEKSVTLIADSGVKKDAQSRRESPSRIKPLPSERRLPITISYEPTDECDIWITKTMGSQVQHKIVNLWVDEDDSMSAVISVSLPFRMRVGFSVDGVESVEALISNSSKFKPCTCNLNQLLHRTIYLEEATYTRIYRDLQNLSSFDVQISSYHSHVNEILDIVLKEDDLPTTSPTIMTQLDDRLWNKLIIAVDLAHEFQSVFRFKHELLNYSSSEVFFQLSFTMQSAFDCVANIFNECSLLKQLEGRDKCILITCCCFEVAVILRIAIMKPNTFAIYFAVNDEVLIIPKLRRFQKMFTDKFIESLHTLVNTMDDYPRRDEVLVAIMCALSLFTERPGISENTRLVVREQRSLFLELLKKYVYAKIESRHWICSFDDIWNKMLRDISRFQYLRQYFS